MLFRLYDNVDTFDGDNEIVPLKNVLNEMYSKDISKKVHASYHLQETKGKFTGVVPPLGYQQLCRYQRTGANLLNRLISKIVISEPQEKKYFLAKYIKQLTTC